MGGLVVFHNQSEGSMDVSQMDDLGRKRVAVAYLVAHMDEVPADLSKMFVKLKAYEASVTTSHQAIQEAKKSIQSLQEQFKELLVSVNTVVEMIVDGLPEDKIGEWCKNYEPEKKPAPPSGNPMPTRQIQRDVDMAGSTAKNLPPISSGIVSTGNTSTK